WADRRPVMGTLARIAAAWIAGRGGAGVPRHPAGLPTALAAVAGGRLDFIDVVVAGVSSSRTPFQSSRRAQLGGGDDACLGPVCHDLAALCRLAAELSSGRRVAPRARACR